MHLRQLPDVSANHVAQTKGPESKRDAEVFTLLFEPASGFDGIRRFKTLSLFLYITFWSLLKWIDRTSSPPPPK